MCHSFRTILVQAQRWRWEALGSAQGRGRCWRKQRCSRRSLLGAGATLVCYTAACLLQVASCSMPSAPLWQECSTCSRALCTICIVLTM